jgi:superfamily II DNA/RNA helicase
MHICWMGIVSLGLSIEHYVHRIGRTGRAGRSGIAHTIFTDYDRPHATALIALLREANQVVPTDILQYSGTPFKSKRGGKKSGGPDTTKHGDAAFQRPVYRTSHLTNAIDHNNNDNDMIMK